MVKTRSTTRKELENKECEDIKLQQQLSSQLASGSTKNDDQGAAVRRTFGIPGSSVKSEYRPPQPPAAPTAKSKSTSSSVMARRKQLELQAAEEKAQIQMALIDKKLELDLANLKDEDNEDLYSPTEEQHVDSRVIVEKWLERSHWPSEPSSRASDNGSKPGSQRAPEVVNPGTSNETVRMLATALQNLTSSSTNNRTDKNLLSRMSTPRELPTYAGDPLDWLQFKQAYQESTEVCGFTPRENLWRLRKCLQGPAKEAVSALMISATTPDVVMNTLELLFGNTDSILNRIMQGLQKLPPMSAEYNKDIVQYSVKIKNFIAAVQAIGRDEYLQGVNIVNIILAKLPTVILSKWADYSFPLINKSRKSRLEILGDFLNEEAVKITTTANIQFMDLRNTGYQHQPRSKPDNVRASRPQMVLVQSTQSDSTNKCLFCRRASHKLTECKLFKKALRKDRWRHVKRYGVCFKCLVSRHDRETCPAPVCDKDGCGEAHHQLLHYVINRDQDDRASQAQITHNASQTADAEPTTETVTHIRSSEHKVLLKVVPINIHGPNGVITTNALLDDGSTITLISGSLAARAGLHGRTESMRVSGAWNDSDFVCTTTVMSVYLSSLNNDTVYKVNARSVDNLKLPAQELCTVDCKQYAHLQKLNDKLLFNYTSCVPEILIGQDNHHLLLPLEISVGKPNEPSATRTPLGWCVHGVVRAGARTPLGARARDAPARLLLLAASPGAAGPAPDDAQALALRNLHDEVRRAFLIDSLGVCSKPRQNDEDVRAIAQLERTATFVNGRWQVGLPWRDEKSVMPDSYKTALNRLKGVERKMAANKDYADRYVGRVDHLFQNDFAREVVNESPSTSRIWYLPHFGVDNVNKKKLRLVFDAAARSDGSSLNDFLLQGPDLLASLFGIMVRFRENRYAVAGDIKDMFLRVKIRPEDQDALRFLWRPNSKQEVKIYAMTSLIFGANCSPFVAQYVKNRNAQRFASTMPAAVSSICGQHYMDDYLDSFPDEAAAIKMVSDIIFIHKEGGFEICNWSSNSEAVLDSVPNGALGSAAIKFKLDRQYEGERTLGLIWYPATDEFGFDLSLKRIPEAIVSGSQVPTKRIMLQVIMSIFDVFGFLSPFTIQGKIMLQELWQLNIGWDENIPDNIFTKWAKWLNLLIDMRHVRVPRCYVSPVSAREMENVMPAAAATSAAGELHPARPAPAPPSPALATSCYETTATAVAKPLATKTYDNLQLHVFCDASILAICSVAYWRWTCNNEIFVAFIASKCRVAPVKALTVPRLELQSAVLAARLADSLIREHRLAVQRRCFWSDSTTVLHWIGNNARNYKQFVANRLGEIDELSRSDEWRYVPTGLNVADIATRDTYDDTLFRNEWLRGPSFLRNDESLWPSNVIVPADTIPPEITERINLIRDLPAPCLPVPDPERCSSWLRLLRSTSNVLKFIRKCRKLTSDVDAELMEQAELLLVRRAQSESFAAEVDAIRKGKSIEKSSRLLTWSPYLDEHGVLRCRGRIGAARDVAAETKHPIILDGRHHVTRLLVKHYHVRAAHANQETVVNNLKIKYAIIRIRPTVKYVAARCMLCRIRKAKPEAPVMGDLPAGRMAHHQRPFTHCGLDLFGPMEVVVGRRREKRYGVIFTCLTVRAIHIEIVHSLTTDSLIMALRRMSARRGWPGFLYSDNGTNLRGADNELKRSIQELNEQALSDEALSNGAKWTFIPPSSPHWGGAWERLIRSIKTTLSVILKERVPKDEVLNTLMMEVESIVNSRPLTHVSVEPGSIEALTPNHFLLGASSNLPALGTFDDSDLFLRKQWRKSQRLADMYWQRWVKEYLPELLPRRKWNQEQKPLQVGDLVLVVDPAAPRNVWPKAIVQKVFPGKDGRVRLVEVRTQSGTLRRSAARVARIPLAEEC